MDTERSSSHSNSGSSRTVAEDTATNDIEAPSQGVIASKASIGKGPSSSHDHHQHDAEKSLPTHEQGRGPAAATTSGDAINQPTPPRNPDESSNLSTINGDLETQEEKYTLVDWDSDEDPLNPINFTETKKWTIMITIGTATLACTCASSMVASTYEGMMEDFHISREVATLSLTLFICGLGSGPLLLAPLSEFYGRRPIYVIGYFIFSCFSFLVAFGNFPGLLVGRFIQGVAGSAFLSVAGGSVSDLWVGPKVGRPMAIYSACPFLGPVLGPLLASFINQSLHWRWTWYISTIWNFAELALIIFFAPETYAPRMLKDKARKLRKETGNTRLKSAAEIKEKEMVMSKAMYVFKSTARPFQLLFFEPMVFLLCLWCALLLGILYAFFSAFPIIFRAKGFNEGQIGLSFLGMGLGIVIATVLNATYYPSLYAKKAKELGHKPPPEEHLKKGMVAAVIGPISLFAFAWTSQPGVHWSAPIILSIPFGVAFTFAFTCSFTYKVDAYRPYAASAMGANSFMRSSFAAGYPLFTVQMYNNLGVTWAGTLNAFLLLALTPCPFLFYKYGARLRKKSRYSDAS